MSFENNEEGGFRFVDEAEIQQMSQAAEESGQEPVQSYEGVDTSSDDVSAEPDTTQDYSDQDVDGAVFEYLSERLGRSISSVDDLVEYKERERAIDERIAVIADFVERTGRDPKDWFFYQSIDPSEMDDLSVVRLNVAAEYPNLSQDEVNMLVNSKYKLDPDVYGEDEVKLSSLQLKIDAAGARKSIDEIRSSFQMPEARSENYSSVIDDNWIGELTKSVNDFDGIEFDLNGKKFTYSIDDKYRSSLLDKNTRLDEFFDPYVREDGTWDYDTLNMHRTVLDNINEILSSAYRQGMSDGQKNIVNKAANVSTKAPNQGGGQKQGDPLADQLREVLGVNNSFMKFL
jgi:hypothetical protein